MSLHSFLFDMFVANEDFKLTDHGLLEIVAKVYPEHIGQPQWRRSRIPVWRSKYNCGQLGQEPPKLSLKYLDGVPVNKNDHPLSDDEIASLTRKFNARLVSQSVGTD